MNHFSGKILLTLLLGLVISVRAQFKTQDVSSTGYLYDRPLHSFEIPATEEEENRSEQALEEEIITEKIIIFENRHEDHESKPEYLPPKTEHHHHHLAEVEKRIEVLEGEESIQRDRKRKLKKNKIKGNLDGESDIRLKRKNNLHRSYSQERGDNLKRKPLTGSKQKR